MNFFGNVFLSFYLLLLFHTGSTYDIISILSLPVKSHYTFIDSLLVALAEKGHRVYSYSPFPKKKSISNNYVDIDISECFTSFVTKTFAADNMASLAFSPSIAMSRLRQSVPTYEQLIGCQPLMDLLHSNSSGAEKHYDLLITEAVNTDIFLAFAHKLRIPFITWIPNVLMPWSYARMGNPLNPSYVPWIILGYDPFAPMDFSQRFYNAFITLYAIVYYRLYNTEQDELVARKLLGSNDAALSMADLIKNTSLMFINSHHSLNSIQPLVPAVIEIGGINVKQSSSPLPTDIETFINESEHGVVYFCMGSLLRGSSFPEEKRNAFLYAFSKIPQRVLWKWEGDELPGKSDKIMTSKWMPQRDILAHPKVKLFISHGGLLGTNEAVYEGVPILGIPIFGDQRTNVRSIEASGAGEMLDYNEISNEVVLEKIQRLINYPKYRENAEQLSRRYRDRPMPPLDTAVYWTEYVIRHKGAPHLRSPAVDMPWYQYLLLDVIAFVIFVLVATLVVIYYVLKFTLRILLRILFRIFTRKPNVSKTSKKVD